jgi:NAD(P)H-hydrate epimerase
MQIYSSGQIKALDAYTIKNEPISSIDLMERAVSEFIMQLECAILFRCDYQQRFAVIAGPGNNGGDALGIARHLIKSNFKVRAWLYQCGHGLSTDCLTNKERLEELGDDLLTIVNDTFTLPEIPEDYIIIDGLFGNGLNRPLKNEYAEVVKHINKLPNEVIAIDIPSGLMAENNAGNIKEHIIRADETLTFQFPKLSFFFPENAPFIGVWNTIDIGLMRSPDITSNMFFVQDEDVCPKLKHRPKFAHKGTAGHALIVAGKPGMAGAAVLAGKACMRAGAGKLTISTQEENRIIIQLGIPEAILNLNPLLEEHSTESLKKFQAVAVGPGIGTSNDAVKKLDYLLSNYNNPMVIDADAINILASNVFLLEKIPHLSILTPHKLELRRLIGETQNDYEELMATKSFAEKKQLIIVIKGAYTKIVFPNGAVYVNSTGNPGMATAGSGDVLTGVISGLLAQNYTPQDAALLGVFLHGKSGDLAAQHFSQESIIASDIIRFLSNAFKYLRESCAGFGF